MTGEEIFREIGGIDSQLVLNAAPGVKVNKKIYYKKWISLAACMSMIIGVFACVFFYKSQNDLPLKPIEASIIWAEDLEDGYVVRDEREKFDKAESYTLMLYQGKSVSSSLYYELMSPQNDAFYGVIVTDDSGQYLPTENDIIFFNSQGIYAEITSETLYIFITCEQFKNLSLSSQQIQEYVFVVANRNAYEKQ